mmetsp:Transcript_93892/g.298029  ORF Transcript_93892/g.298029 Transcript_93892/m.298029 type:complete len:382 (-) Transcript_93892:37-1182(-)
MDSDNLQSPTDGASGELLHLAVVTVGGQESFRAALPPTASVRELRKRIEDNLSVPRPRQWLLHGSSMLPSRGCLADCGVTDGSQITLVVRPPGARIITASDDSTAKVWDADSRELLVTLQGHSADLWMAVFSPDGELALTASDDRSARLWDTETGEVLRAFEGGHRGAVNSATFSRDGSLVVTGSDDGLVILWNAATGEVARTLEVGNDVMHAVLSSDSSLVLVGTERAGAQLWTAEGGERVRTFKGHAAAVHRAEFSSDDLLACTASRDWSVRLWWADTAECLQVLNGPDEFLSAAFLPGDAEVLAVSHSAVTVFSVASGAPTSTFSTPGLICAALSPTGWLAVAGDEHGGIKAWAGEKRATAESFSGHGQAVRWVEFSP